MSVCDCNDHQLDELRDLVARGFDQMDVSRLLWGDQPPRNRELLLLQVRRQATRFVRSTLAARLPWLRLPTPELEETP